MGKYLASPRSGNALLDLLPAPEYQLLFPLLKAVPLILRQSISRYREPINYAYFPTDGVISAMTIMLDGSAIEVATVGKEGVVGFSAFLGSSTSPNEVMVQVAGQALRILATDLETAATADNSLRRLLVLYNSAFATQVSYSVACNGLHVVEKRCCRWLLMTQDRVGSDELPLTHEFLAIMLGVRRPSVTEVLKPLHDRGLIQSARGKIRILDRTGLEATTCECYAAIKTEFSRLFSQN